MELDSVVVVGAGFSGSILARGLAESGHRVLVLEKRGHVAGNMYDEPDERGILVQRYGPHTFHTDRREAYDYVCQFASMKPYTLTYRTVMKGIPVPCPFNFQTIRMLYPEKEAEALIHRLKQNFPGRDSVAIFELLESEDETIRSYASLLFEEDFRPYTAKQWGKNPEEIDKSVIRRVPVLLNDRDSYFSDKYECLPDGGFTKMFRNMLDHPNIRIVTSCDALQKIAFDEEKGTVSYEGRDSIRLIYTGAIDEFFQCRFGRLPYRSLFFEYRSIPQKSFQKTAIVAYPKNTDYTRITEYTKLPPQRCGERTVIAVEYPLPYVPQASKGNEPYYPIPSPESLALYGKYKSYASKFRNLILCGRLADYKYYNMDDAVLHALETLRSIGD